MSGHYKMQTDISYFIYIEFLKSSILGLRERVNVNRVRQKFDSKGVKTCPCGQRWDRATY